MNVTHEHAANTTECEKIFSNSCNGVKVTYIFTSNFFQIYRHHYVFQLVFYTFFQQQRIRVTEA